METARPAKVPVARSAWLSGPRRTMPRNGCGVDLWFSAIAGNRGLIETRRRCGLCPVGDGDAMALGKAGRDR
jgi:hypothetical protein